MLQGNNSLQLSRYLFILAHPDDEIYTCAFIAKLVQEGKNVNMLYVTSGDYNGADIGKLREKEVSASMKILGVSENNIYFLRIPERQLIDRLPEVAKDVLIKTKIINPDCIIGHDYEGGHNGHDAVSFCAYRATQKLNIPLYVFPAYHNWPEKRLWNQFIDGREPTYTLELTDKQKGLQNQVISSHKTQETFFNTIKQSDSYKFFSTREILRLALKPIDYIKPPTTPVGYEYPGGKIRFEDFKKAVILADNI
ncbi:MAG: hypothetical protein A2648_01740 [Candidatus Lloydbacteria bacterium RIFCSPHIGHO2_01_FULL_41_20]|uniref:GlcNAc-PI de-N-acetylase n=1 Tax=Candidatus Lloydbacteria bacterium RIFCSPHIGHO2_01_FULL_41_20 TaxID=1798657 RepID=A0A1G2CSS6_9BACT|nr:MAG: hypothetical protein A2648_01740 [Candidatus Lloydbacteria bacterium RIFCSPHIGHO2_01_FULL_41_20]